MSRISMEETRKVMASSLSCTLVRNWPCKNTAGFLNHSTSSVPGMASAIFQPSFLLIGIGQHQVGGLRQGQRFEMSRQRFRRAPPEAEGDPLPPAGVQTSRIPLTAALTAY